MTRTWIPLGALLLGALPAAPALAQPLVVVAPLDGDRGAAREALVEGLAGAARVADGARVDALAAELDAAPDAPEVLRALGARAVVTGRVARRRRAWWVDVRVHDAAGAPLARRRLRSRRTGRLVRRLRGWASSALADAIAELPAPDAEASPASGAAEAAEARPVEPGASAPSAAGEPTAPSTRPEAPPAAPRDAGGPLPLELEAGLALVHRSFRYTDDLFGRLRGYGLPAAPFVHLGARWYPAAHVGGGPLAGLGVRLAGAFGLALQSRGANDVTFPTEAWSVEAGLRYRLAVDEVVLHADAGYHAHAFTIGAAEDGRIDPDVPSVELHSLRVGAGLRWELPAGVFFTGGGAYLAPVAVGGVTDEAWFPRASAGGVEADGGLGVRLGDLEVAARFAWRRYFYAMNTLPGDARVAGGALDDYLAGRLTLGWTPR